MIHWGICKQLCLQTRRSSSSASTITALQAAFRDPSSPFHIPSGTEGPSSPNETPRAPPHASLHSLRAAESDIGMKEAQERLLEQGYDPASFWEQKIVWGDHDSFQHVNNVRYVRFLESGRMVWLTSVGQELGGDAAASDLLRGRGVSLILKSISVDFKRPVVFPDTLLIAHRPLPYPASHRQHRTHLPVDATAYSLAQKCIVTESSSVLVWYDYNALKKCDPGDERWNIIHGRVRHRK